MLQSNIQSVVEVHSLACTTSWKLLEKDVRADCHSWKTILSHLLRLPRKTRSSHIRPYPRVSCTPTSTFSRGKCDPHAVMDRELEAKEGADPKKSFMIGKRNNTQKKHREAETHRPKWAQKLKQTVCSKDTTVSWRRSFANPKRLNVTVRSVRSIQSIWCWLRLQRNVWESQTKMMRNVFFSKKMVVRKFVLCMYIYIYIYIYIWYVLLCINIFY